MKKIELIGPATPGAKNTVDSTYSTLRAARRAAEERFGNRRDLTYQDVIIRQPGRQEYAGPCR